MIKDRPDRQCGDVRGDGRNSETEVEASLLLGKNSLAEDGKHTSNLAEHKVRLPLAVHPPYIDCDRHLRSRERASAPHIQTKYLMPPSTPEW